MTEKLITLSNLSEFKTLLDQALAAKGFITKVVNDLTNYYLKSEIYTKEEVQELIAAVKQFTYDVVPELPEPSAATMYKLYLVPAVGGSGTNVKSEHLTIRSGVEGSYTYRWEKIGDTDIDLSGYSTTQEMNEAIAAAVRGFKTEAQIRAIVTSYNYATQADMTTALSGKVDKETGKGLSTNDYTTAEKAKLAGIASGAQVNVLEELNLCEVEGKEKVVIDSVEIESKTGSILVASEEDIRYLFNI